MEVPACPGCRERDARIASLGRRVAELEALVRELTARLGTNASNSGIPPSANPLGAPSRSSSPSPDGSAAGSPVTRHIGNRCCPPSASMKS